MKCMKPSKTQGAFTLAAVLLISAGLSHGEVQMKSRGDNVRFTNRLSRAKSRQANRSHLVLDFRKAPNAETVRELGDRGLRVVAFLPLTGVIVAAEGEPDLTGMDLVGFDALEPSDKVSSELITSQTVAGRARAVTESAQGYYVVEFHEDVALLDRVALATEAGLVIRNHPDLVASHMLVNGTLKQVTSLAEWDEVAYIFPASGELVTGLPLIGCVGGATETGQVGQLTQRVGEGWDGPGLGSASLTYTLQAMTRKVPVEQAQQEILRAMAEWSSVVKINFQKGSAAGGSRNINILFGSKDHGDPYAFDGPGHILAHTFYPAPPNPEPIAGDLHFDEDENWNIGSDIDLYSVALHELGHALGLGHSDVPNAVMYPYYRRAEKLTAEDIGAIRLLYAAATDTTDGGIPVVPLSLSVTAPSSPATTTASSASLSGTVKGAQGAVSMAWSTARGAAGAISMSGDGAGGYSWQATVPVELGDNVITVKATDSQNRAASVSVQVLRTAPPTTPTTPTTPPAPPTTPTTPTTPTPAALSLEVTSPGPSSVVTKNPITATGTITGGSGRPTVRWSNDRGYSGTAVVTATGDGAYRWDISPLAVQLGANSITVMAIDTANKTSSKNFRVTYNLPTEESPNGDNKPPQITIQSPNTSFLMTPAYSIAVRGTATDSSGVVEVRWECSCGSRGAAQGTSQWTIPNIGLPAGSHTIKIFAKDVAGNESSASFMVFRYEN